MKATGVVRRIDELGRIVIPKEIRRTLKIKEGTPLEIYSGEEGELILKKYSPIFDLSIVAGEIAESIHSILQKSVLITDMEKIIATNNSIKSKYIDSTIDNKIEKLISQRKSQIVSTEDENVLLFLNTTVKNFAISPILTNGDIYGSIIIFDENKLVEETEKIVSSGFAEFISKQIG